MDAAQPHESPSPAAGPARPVVLALSAVGGAAHDMRLPRRLGHGTTLVAGASRNRFAGATLSARLCGAACRSPAAAFPGSPHVVEAVEEAMRQHRARGVAAGPLSPAAPHP